MPIASIIEKLRAKLDDISFAEIGEWKGNHPGGKAIGWFPVYAPVEIVHAGGMLPVHISGAMGRIKLDEADGYLQSFVCSVGRSTLELKLDGALDELDGMIFPSACEISRGLSGVWRRHDTKPVIYIHLPQNLDSAYSKDYLVGELNRVKSALEEISGVEITASALQNSFGIYNRRAELLDSLEQFRSEHPEILSASELYILRQAGMRIPPEEHAGILEEALSAVKVSGERHPVKIRMVMVGAFCERPPVEMLETIENEGVAIVADDLLFGQSWWLSPLPTTGDPIEALAEHYINDAVLCSIVYRPGCCACSNILESVKINRADGVILSSAKFCRPVHHDNTAKVKACEEHGLPYIMLEFEEDQRVFESLRVKVEALLEARDRLPWAGIETEHEAGMEG